MNFHSLIHEIHIAASGDLNTLKTRVIESGFAGQELETGNFSQYYNLAYSHIWREFNKKCFLCGLTGLMVRPYDAGFRPKPGVLSTGVSATGSIPDNIYLQPDGIGVYFQPDGESFYLQPS